jgi:hypothetical protein
MARPAVLSLIVLFVTAWLLPATSSGGADANAAEAAPVNVATR